MEIDAMLGELEKDESVKTKPKLDPEIEKILEQDAQLLEEIKAGMKKNKKVDQKSTEKENMKQAPES